MPLLRIRQKLAVKRDDDAMVSIVIYNHVAIKTKINGTHNGVSTLLVDKIFQCGTIRVDHLMKAIQNRIGVALVRVLGEESSLLCRDSQSLGKLLGIFFRYELLSFEGGSEPNFVHPDYFGKFLIGKSGGLFRFLQSIEVIGMLQSDKVIGIAHGGHDVVLSTQAF